MSVVLFAKRAVVALCTVTMAQMSFAIDKRVATDIAACEDFFEYANRTWMKETTIPADRARWGSFNQLQLANRQALIEALSIHEKTELAKLPTPGKQKALAHFRAGINLEAIEKAQLASLDPLLIEINRIKAADDLPNVLGLLARHLIIAPLSVSISPDTKDKSRYLVQIAQGGLGLPDRDDYLKDSDTAKRYRDAYASYRRTLLGDDAAATYELESSLARASMPRERMRDPNLLVNYQTIESLEKLAPNFDWKRFLSAAGIKAFGNSKGQFNVAHTEFVTAFAKATRDVPVETWKRYLRLRVLDASGAYLHRDMRDAEFAYRTTALTGVKTELPRGERVIDLISGRVGSEPLAEGLGQFFVDRAFPAEAKTKAVSMVEDIKAALRVRLNELEWMSDATRKQAIAKLDAMALKIGYADQWKTYDGLDIRSDDFAGNWLRARAWEHAQRVARLGKPVDRNDWFSAPHTVNAFAGSYNDIVFPAGILQPPFFDAKASDAQNFGAIGMVIGHEITHHFDDRGRQFDAFGNLNDWWTTGDAAAYKARAAQVIAQFDAYEPVPGTRVSGVNTQGENISDLGGLKIAYLGLQRALAREKKGTEKKVGALSPNETFFLSFGQMWRELHRTESLINQLRTGNHSPGRYRVNGPLANFKAFADTFGCKAGVGLVRAEGEMISIW